MKNPGETIKENLDELGGKIFGLLEKFEKDNGVKITCIDYKHAQYRDSFGGTNVTEGFVKIYIEIL